MAGTVEEDFVFREIYNLSVPCQIFEFGCGQNLFINKIVELGHNITAIDLYERTADNKENRKYNFLRGDFIEFYKLFDLGLRKYDCVYALSSVEHIGLEDIILEWDQAEKKLKDIIDAIWNLLKDDGIFLVTLPFGNYKAFYVDKEGNNSKVRKNNSLWGAKVYDLKDIDNVFLTDQKGSKNRFKLISKELYLKTDPKSDYFDKNSWIITRYEECYKTDEPANALVCIKLKKIITKFGDGISWEKFADEVLKETKGIESKISFIYEDKKDIINHIEKYIKADKLENKDVLDCGCHIGRWTTLLKSRGFNYVGVDQSTKAIEIAKKCFPTTLFYNKFLWDIHFYKEFDLAFCNNVLQHNNIEEKNRILTCIHKTLKHNGILFINESTVNKETMTQLTYEGWINLMNNHGFEFLESWQPNNIGLDECYLFRKR